MKIQRCGMVCGRSGGRDSPSESFSFNRANNRALFSEEDWLGPFTYLRICFLSFNVLLCTRFVECIHQEWLRSYGPSKRMKRDACRESD